jgi:hypothetical protein
VVAEVMAGGSGQGDGLLVHTRGLARSHSRMAAALSRKRVNIVLGKVNRVIYGPAESGFRYYWHISPPGPGQTRVDPRELEQVIAGETPQRPERMLAPGTPQGHGIRVELLGDDGEGYQLQWNGEAFQRLPTRYGRVRLIMEDQPLLFYRACQVFDAFDVEVHQAMITTTGTHVLDTFYVLPAGLERLRSSNFVAAMIHRMNTPAMPLAAMPQRSITVG